MHNVIHLFIEQTSPRVTVSCRSHSMAPGTVRMSSSRPGLPTGIYLSFPFPFLAVVAASAARTCSKQSSVEKICVPRFPTVIPARFRFRASLASLSPWFSLSKTVFLAFTASTADTSEVMRFLTGVGIDGLQDCRSSTFSLV